VCSARPVRGRRRQIRNSLGVPPRCQANNSPVEKLGHDRSPRAIQSEPLRGARPAAALPFVADLTEGKRRLDRANRNRKLAPDRPPLREHRELQSSASASCSGVKWSSGRSRPTRARLRKGDLTWSYISRGISNGFTKAKSNQTSDRSNSPPKSEESGGVQHTHSVARNVRSSRRPLELLFPRRRPPQR
jgi:hypothetical protein